MPMVGTETILGVEVEVHANSSGTWQIKQKGDGDVLGHGSTLEQATNNARTTINKNKVKLHIDFVTREGKRGYATGMHQRSHKILTVIQGEKVHLDHYRANVLRADTPNDELDHLKLLDEKIEKLNAERQELIAEWKFDLGEAVKEAIDKGVEG